MVMGIELFILLVDKGMPLLVDLEMKDTLKLKFTLRMLRKEEHELTTGM